MFNRLVVEDAAFKELKKGFIVEDKIEGKDAFNILANRCNITLAPKSELYESVKEMAPYIPEEFEVKYSDIRDITVVEYNRHRSMIETGFCSLVRKLEYEKYVLKMKFKPETPEAVLSELWGVPARRLEALSELNERKHDCLVTKLFDELKYRNVIDFF